GQERRTWSTVWLRAAASAAGDLAVRARELRQPRADRPDLDPALHRGQLAFGRADQRHLVRPDRRLPRGHVRLLASCDAPAPARSRHRPAFASACQDYFKQADAAEVTGIGREPT